MRNQLPQNFSIPVMLVSSSLTAIFGLLVLGGANNIAFSAMLACGCVAATCLMVEIFRK